MEVKYRFIATGVVGQREVFPQNGNTLSITYQKEDGRALFIKKLKGKLLFTSDDFKWFLTMEQSQYRCEPVTLLIEKFCPNGGLSTIFIARLIFNDGTFDLDQCQLDISADELDKYTCYNDNKSEEKNLISQVFPKITISLIEGEIEYKECTGSTGDDIWCGVLADLDKGWTILQYDQENDTSIPPDQPQQYTFTVLWIRELKTSVTPLSAPWISIGGNDYARVPAVYGYTSYSNPQSSGYAYKVGGVIDNGMSLKGCFESFLVISCNNLTLKSDFFQWNPENVSTINYVTGLPSKVANLVLFQASDVKRAGALNNATRAEISFEDLLNDICNTFNCEWDITDNGKFVIEHVSFFQKGIGLDLVNRYDARLREGTRKYSYDKDNMPRKEIFTMKNSEFQAGDFRGVPILYQGSCVGKGDKETKDWQVENLMTDVELALKNGSPNSDVVPDEGFVLIACNATNKIITEAAIFTGNTLNNSLSWAHLHVDYWRHKRVLRSFLMNNVQTSALSTIPTKKQIKITAKICCGESFDADFKVLSTLGTGIVADAQYNIFLETLDLNLLYDAEANLTMNQPPVANTDSAVTYQNVAIDIDVLANDTDADGTINTSTLTITSGGAHGVSSIVGGKIRYIPNNGYSGSDIITYTIKDNWSQISNIGTVNILVKAGSSLPIASDDNFNAIKNTTLTVGGLLSNDTGDGMLSCVPETKATTAGGTVQIYANGSFVYTPLAGYVGADSFDYTLKDANNNTDVGTANITVANRLTVYAKLTIENQTDQKISEYCDSNLIVVGREYKQDLRIRYYSDNAATVPLNVDGYNLTVGIEEMKTGTGGGTFNDYFIASGVDDVKNVIYDRNYEGCGLPVSETFTSTFSLVPSSDYTII